MEHLALETGVHHSQISRIERGESARLSKNVLKICDFLHILTMEDNPLAVTGDIVEKMQALIQEWPQSEKLIYSVLDSMRQAFESQDRSGAKYNR